MPSKSASQSVLIILQGISSLKKKSIPPMTVIVNWDIGKLLSILVSQIIIISSSISFLMIFISKSDLFLIELILFYWILICINMILEGFSILTLCKLEPRFCWSLSKNLELFKGLLLTEFLVTSVILKFLVDISSSFAKRFEGTA